MYSIYSGRLNYLVVKPDVKFKAELYKRVKGGKYKRDRYDLWLRVDQVTFTNVIESE